MKNDFIDTEIRGAWNAYVSEHQALVQRAVEEVSESVLIAAKQITEAFQSGKKLLLFGNGGSAGDAQHIAAEFVGRFRLERDAMNAVALTVNTSILTAISNDYGEKYVFARQIEAIGQVGDVAIGLSTSGKSGNVLYALEKARSKGLKTVLLTGADCDETAAELCIKVPSKTTSLIQEVHLIIGHFLAGYTEKNLFV